MPFCFANRILKESIFVSSIENQLSAVFYTPIMNDEDKDKPKTILGILELTR